MLFGALGRVYSRRPWPCLRFRTNDVLLGTSGVGVRFSVVSIQLFRPVNIFIIFWLYRFRIHLLRPHLSGAEQRPLDLSSGCQIDFGLEGGRKVLRSNPYYLTLLFFIYV